LTKWLEIKAQTMILDVETLLQYHNLNEAYHIQITKSLTCDEQRRSLVLHKFLDETHKKWRNNSDNGIQNQTTLKKTTMPLCYKCSSVYPNNRTKRTYLEAMVTVQKKCEQKFISGVIKQKFDGFRQGILK